MKTRTKPGTRVDALRRKAVVTASCCAILGGFVPLALHGHRWMAFVVMGLQMVLLVAAMRFFVLSNKAASGRAVSNKAGARR